MRTPLVVALDLGHGPGTPKLTGSRSTEGITERAIVSVYLDAAMERLGDAGVDVHPYREGAYADRQAAALAAGCAIYVVCHADAGQPGPRPYGSVFYRWDREGETRPLADIVGRHLARVANPGRVIVAACAPEAEELASLSARNWPRPFGVLSALPGRLLGLCYEPFTVDRTEHYGLRRDPSPAGYALAGGILEYLELV